MNIRLYFNFVQLYLNFKFRYKFLLPDKVYPFRASIRLTENCNSKCITCNYWKKKWEDRISTHDAIKIIQKLKKIKIERIRFTGGEPLLRKDFFEIIDTINNGDFKKITVATNGLLLKKYADKINNSCITDLGVSIDGMSETNDMIRGIKGYFNTVFEGISKIKKRVTVMTTLNQYNAYELDELINLCEDYGVLWDFNLLDNRLFFLKGNNLSNIWPDKNAVNHIMYVIRKNMNRPVLKRINQLQLNYAEQYLKRLPIDEPRCYLGYTDIDIDSSGNLWTGCYVLPPIGNVLKDEIEVLLNSNSYKKRLLKMLNRECPGCTCGYELNLFIEHLPCKIYEFFVLKKRK